MRLGFLDGLRGWGAAFVLLCHVFVDGLPVDAVSRDVLSRLVPFNGSLAVLVFFLVSGFSLSARYLADGDLGPWARIAAGRYFRLAIPVFAACLLVHLAMLTGAIAPGQVRPAPFNGMLNFGPTTAHLLRFGLFDAFFGYREDQSYILPLWTMSIELAGSALVLAAILMLRPLSFRIAILLALAAAIALAPLPATFSMLALFPAGAALADGFNRRWFDVAPGWLGPALISAGCLVAAFWPLDLSPISQTAAIALVVGAIATPAIRKALENPFSAWLGRISFPLYLMHGPALWAVGEPLTRGFGAAAGTRLAIDLLTVALSIGAAILFVPVNEFAIRVSRLVGQRLTSGLRRWRL